MGTIWKNKKPLKQGSVLCCCYCWSCNDIVDFQEGKNFFPQGKHLSFYVPGVSCQGHQSPTHKPAPPTE